MHNLLKLAADNLDKPNIIVTASILRRLKNKLLNLFDSSRREKVDALLEKSEDVKPLLVEIYSLIKKMESSIEDLDIDDYENTTKELKTKITDLSSKLEDVKKLTEKTKEAPKEAPKEESKESPKEQPKETPKEESKEETRQRSPKTESEFSSKHLMYKGITTLSQLGVTANNILENKVGPKAIYSSWGFVNLATDTKSAEKVAELQKGIKDDDMRRIFYDDIPNYRILSIMPREISQKSKQKKKGVLEIRVQSPVKALPIPASNWKLSVIFTLIDNYGEPTRPGNYIIYRQLVVYAKDESSGEAEVWSEQEAYNNEQNLGTIELE